MGKVNASRSLLSFARRAACALALAAACAKYSGPPDPNFAKARDLYQQLYATQLDEAYGDLRMDEVVSLLQGVSRRSVDAPSAIALLHAIDNGRTELAKIVDRDLPEPACLRIALNARHLNQAFEKVGQTINLFMNLRYGAFAF